MSLNTGITLNSPSELLQETRAQGGKLFFKFSGNVSGLSDLRGILLDFDRSTFKMEVIGLKAASHNFEGQAVRCYIKLRDPQDHQREIFYTFATTWLEAEQRGSGRIVATLKLPSSIETGQRRKSLRLTPNLKNFTAFAMWLYDKQSCIDMENPSLNLTGLLGNLGKIENISAGGMKITLRRQLLRDLNLIPAIGAHFIFRFSVQNIKEASEHEFWAIAKTRRLEEDPITKDASLALEFVAEGSLNPESGKMSWQKVANNTIEELASVFLQWHMEFHREKGL